jgi:hypothetical protein
MCVDGEGVAAPLVTGTGAGVAGAAAAGVALSTGFACSTAVWIAPLESAPAPTAAPGVADAGTGSSAKAGA